MKRSCTPPKPARPSPAKAPSLASFFAALAPALEGTAKTGPAAKALGVDPLRLGMYGQMCAVHRESLLDSMYPNTRIALGARRWDPLVAAFHRRFPPRHFELNANAEPFALLLKETPGVAPWIVELADLEWQEWIVMRALEAAPSHVWTIHPSVVLRMHHFDVAGWADDDDAGPGPAVREHIVLLWRSKKTLAVRHAIARPAELIVLKAVSENVGLEEAARAAKLALAALQRARERLEKRGVLVSPMIRAARVDTRKARR